MLIAELKPEHCERILSELTDRFGFDKKIFNSFEFYRTKDNVYACTKGAIELAKGIAGVQDLGFAFARFGVNLKITTNIVQMIGRHASKNFVSVSEKEAKQFIAGKDIELSKDKAEQSSANVASQQQTENATNGFVIIRFGADNLGVGFLRGPSLKNLLPGAKKLPTFDF